MPLFDIFESLFAWLSISDVGTLDSAFTSKRHRNAFLEFISGKSRWSYSVRNPRFHTVSILKWHKLRGSYPSGLFLADTKLTDVDLYFSRDTLKYCERICFDECCQLNDVSIAIISETTGQHLKELAINSSTKISVESIRYLSAFNPNLERLHYDKGSPYIRESLHLEVPKMVNLLSKLHGVSLDYLVISEATILNLLLNVNALREIQFRGCHISQQGGTSQISDGDCAKSIQKLHFNNCINVKGSFLEKLLAICSDMVDFGFAGCSIFSDEHLAVLAESSPSLRSLNVSDTSISDAGLMPALKRMPCLEYLDISYNAEITDASLSVVGCTLRSLRQLELRFCPLVTGPALQGLQTCYDRDVLPGEFASQLIQGSVMELADEEDQSLVLPINH
jgi:hypothetical protein